MDVAPGVDRHRITRMDDDGGAWVLDDRRAGEAHPRIKPVGVVDVGQVRAFEREVDFAGSLPRRDKRRARDGHPTELELADLGRRDEMEPDDFDGCVETVGIFPLVYVMELLE